MCVVQTCPIEICVAIITTTMQSNEDQYRNVFILCICIYAQYSNFKQIYFVVLYF